VSKWPSGRVAKWGAAAAVIAVCIVASVVIVPRACSAHRASWEREHYLDFQFFNRANPAVAAMLNELEAAREDNRKELTVAELATLAAQRVGREAFESHLGDGPVLLNPDLDAWRWSSDAVLCVSPAFHAWKHDRQRFGVDGWLQLRRIDDGADPEWVARGVTLP
jgi:hypothetical protein